jgi:hypothetical protein
VARARRHVTAGSGAGASCRQQCTRASGASEVATVRAREWIYKGR